MKLIDATELLKNEAPAKSFSPEMLVVGIGFILSAEENANERDLAYVREDSELMDYLAESWNSQGRGHHLMGRWFPNVSGSFRDAIRSRIDALPNVNVEARR